MAMTINQILWQVDETHIGRLVEFDRLFDWLSRNENDIRSEPVSSKDLLFLAHENFRFDNARQDVCEELYRRADQSTTSVILGDFLVVFLEDRQCYALFPFLWYSPGVDDLLIQPHELDA